MLWFKKKPHKTQKVGKILCKALGLDPKKVFWMQLTCEVGDITSIQTKQYVYDKDVGKFMKPGDKLKKVLKTYKLVEIDNQEVT